MHRLVHEANRLSNLCHANCDLPCVKSDCLETAMGTAFSVKFLFPSRLAHSINISLPNEPSAMKLYSSTALSLTVPSDCLGFILLTAALERNREQSTTC